MIKLFTAAFLLIVIAWPVAARDLDGRYAAQNPELHRWFEGLRSKGGSLCCSDADGRSIEDPDWKVVETPTPHFQVRQWGNRRRPKS